MKPGSLKSLRVPAAEPINDDFSASPESDFGTIYVKNADGTPYEDSFVSDIITVDLETLPEYKADVVYFGTVSGGWSPAGWGGRMYRLVTRKPGIIASGSSQVVSRPYEWPTLLDSDSLENPNILYDPSRPIVSPPTVGTDGLDFWVYFGTGRFFDVDDKTDPSSNDIQTFYGIREPISCSSDTFVGINWKTVTNTTPSDGPQDGSKPRGNIGLLPVEDIAIRLLNEADTDGDGILDPDEDLNNNGVRDLYTGVTETTPGVVGCYDANRDFIEIADSCVPGIVGSGDQLESKASFDDLTRYIVGNNILCSPPTDGASPGFDGWSKDLLNYKERNLGQATLLGGLLSYSTYIPNVDVCNPEGSGYLYGIYYQTGTSWYEDVFLRTPPKFNEPIETGVFLGSGLSTTPNIHVGEEEGGKAFIQTSVGQIVEIPQPNLPMKDVTPGRIKWRDVE
jgi:type IV pilus assembly protein PilY1